MPILEDSRDTAGGMGGSADAAWAVLATLTMIRWVAALGLEHKATVVAKTTRRKYIALPGSLTHRSRRTQLHLPTR